MDAWILDESPGTYRWGTIAEPEVGPDDVAVQPVASALNHMDLWLTRGLPRPKLPHVPGCDVAGVVTAVGDAVTTAAVGDEVVVNPAVSPLEAVVALGVRRAARSRASGSWASSAGVATALSSSCRHATSSRSPLDRTWEECAAYPLATLTAWRMLRRARLRAGERCLIVGIGGGVSAAALHLAVRMGAEVHVTSRDPAKAEAALALGAAAAYDSGGDWPVKVQVVVESVGPATWERSVSALEPGGRLVVCGGTSGPDRRGQPAEALLQADRDHRFDHGVVHRVRRGHPTGRAGLAGVRRCHLRPR